MSRPSSLPILVRRAVHSLRFYDAAAACSTIGAMGDLRIDGLHAPELIRYLAPCLPTYTHTQLTALLQGLSLLRVSHYMMTAYVLKLFLAALRQSTHMQVCGEQAPRSLSALYQEEVAAVAAMASVLQQHHTQRTVRAFLAAADRALTRKGGQAPDERVCASADSQEKQEMTNRELCCVPPSRHSSSCEYGDRQAAVQLLYLLEVFINAGICVAAPHTPLWLRRMLKLVPLHFFTLREILHVHTRLFLKDENSAPFTADTDSVDLAFLEFEQCCHIAGAAARPMWETVRTTHRCATQRVEQVDAAQQTKRFSFEHQRLSEGFEGKLSAVERYAVLRCAVMCKLRANGVGAHWDSTMLPHPSTGAATCASAEAWRPFWCALSFYRLTREFCRVFCAESWRWWLRRLEDYVERPGIAFTTPVRSSSSLMVVQDATLLSIVLLQCMHAQYAHSLAAGSSSDVECPPKAALLEEGTCFGTQVADSVDTAIRLLCILMPLCCTPTSPSPLSRTVESQTWELLSLLLAMGSAAHDEADGVSFFQWTEMLLQRRSRLLCNGGVAAEAAPWERFCQVRTDALSYLMVLWCQYWRQDPVFLQGHWHSTMRRLSPSAESPLYLHWHIAEETDSLLYRAEMDSQGFSGHAPILFWNATTDSLRCAWQALVATTATLYEQDDEEVCHSRVRMSPSSTALMTDFLCMLLEVVRRRKASMPCFSSPLLDLVWQSSLPEGLCGAVELAAVSDSADHPPVHGADSPLFLFSHNTTKRNTCPGPLRRQRVWWAPTDTGDGALPELASALRQLLHTAFFGNSASGFDVAADEDTSMCLSWWRWWPCLFRLLILHMRRHSTYLSSHPLLGSSAATVGAQTGGRIPSQRYQECLSSLLHQSVDGVAHTACAAALHAIRPAFPAPPPPACETAALSTSSAFDAQLSDTMMCNIESLWNWDNYDFWSDTLRDDRNGHPPLMISSSGSCVAALSLLQQMRWRRDDRVIHLTTRDERREQKAVAGVHAAHVAEGVWRSCEGGAGCLQQGGREEGDGGGERPTEEESLLADLIEPVRLTTGAALLFNACNSDLPPTPPRHAGEASPRRSAAGDALSDAPSPLLNTFFIGGALATLQTFFWAYCQDVLTVCSTQNRESEESFNSSAWVRFAEPAVLRGVLAWRTASQISFHRRGTVQDSGGALSTPLYSNDVPLSAKAEHQVFALLLPLLWHALHEPHRTPTGQIDIGELPAALTCGAVPNALLDVRRLRIFADEWCRHLPLIDLDAPAHVRFVMCLRACLPTPRDGNTGGLDSALRCSVAELETTVRLKSWLDSVPSQTRRPFRFLSETLESICQMALQRGPTRFTDSAEGSVGFDAAARGMTAGCNGYPFGDLSPIEMYINGLLPLHPFLRSSSSLFPGVHPESETRLVVVTWIHVLVMQTLCTHHPRFYFQRRGPAHKSGCHHEENNTPSIACMHKSLTALGALEQKLLNVKVGVPGPTYCAAADTQYQLLYLCLVRELKAALAALNIFVSDSPEQRPSVPYAHPLC